MKTRLSTYAVSLAAGTALLALASSGVGAAVVSGSSPIAAQATPALFTDGLGTLKAEPVVWWGWHRGWGWGWRRPWGWGWRGAWWGWHRPWGWGWGWCRWHPWAPRCRWWW